jgi:hypothetical protein
MRKTIAIGMTLASLLLGCGENGIEEKRKAPAVRHWQLYRIDVPRGANLDRYLTGEHMEHRISYSGISDVLRQVNPDDKSAFFYGAQEGRVSLREGRPLIAPDYNGDGKVLGVEGEPVGVFSVSD